MLSPGQAAHFDVYTLFCRYMADQIESLRVACDGTKLSFNECTERFDTALRKVLNGSVIDRARAIDVVARNLKTAVEDFADVNSDASALVASAREEALDNQTTWHYSLGLEACHEQGRNLALLFFEKANQTEIQSRLGLRAQLHYQFGNALAAQQLAAVRELSPSPERQRLESIIIANMTREENSIYRDNVLPGAVYTFQGVRDDEFSINVPLTPENNLALYISYPFLFMHEYTAHIFSTDYRNDSFNDGWMLYAASRYLLSNWTRDPRLSALTSPTIFAFKRHLLPSLSKEARNHCNFAEEFDHFLLPWDPSRFDSITFELAAYEPRAREDKTWPTRVLRKLSSAMLNRQALERALAAAAGLDALYPGLKLELPAGRRV